MNEKTMMPWGTQGKWAGKPVLREYTKMSLEHALLYDQNLWGFFL